MEVDYKKAPEQVFTDAVYVILRSMKLCGHRSSYFSGLGSVCSYMEYSRPQISPLMELLGTLVMRSH